MARGMKYMLAITWSVPRPTKHITGIQMAKILEIISRAEMERKTAIVTSQSGGGRLVRASGRISWREGSFFMWAKYRVVKGREGKANSKTRYHLLARMPRRNIWCQPGVTTLVVAKARVSVWYAPVENVPPSGGLLAWGSG